jgi:hypothetical protein
VEITAAKSVLLDSAAFSGIRRSMLLGVMADANYACMTYIFNLIVKRILDMAIL